MSLFPKLLNFADSDIVTTPSPASSGTTCVVTTGKGARFAGTALVPVPAVIWNITDFANPSDDTNHEIVTVTGVSTDTLTIVRAQEGTSAITAFTGGKTYRIVQGVTAGLLDGHVRAQRGAYVTGIVSAADASQATFVLPAGTLRVGDLLRITEFWRKSASTTGWQRSTKIGTSLSTAISMGISDTSSKVISTYMCESASVARGTVEYTKSSAGTGYNVLHFNPTDDFTASLTIDWHANFTSSPAGGETLLFSANIELIRGL